MYIPKPNELFIIQFIISFVSSVVKEGLLQAIRRVGCVVLEDEDPLGRQLVRGHRRIAALRLHHHPWWPWHTHDPSALLL